jgi:hypothetical protein
MLRRTGLQNGRNGLLIKPSAGPKELDSSCKCEPRPVAGRAVDKPHVTWVWGNFPVNCHPLR